MRRGLQSIGMTAFVTHRDLFEGSQTNGDAATDLQVRSGWTTRACRSRISTARRILDAARKADALKLITRCRLPDKIRNAARAPH